VENLVLHANFFMHANNGACRRPTCFAAALTAPAPAPHAMKLHEATGLPVASQDEVRRFLRSYAEIDLTGVRLPNPFVRGVRFSRHGIACHRGTRTPSSLAGVAGPPGESLS